MIRVARTGRFVGFLRYRNETDVTVEAYEPSTGIERTLDRRLNDLYPSWVWAEDSRDILVSDQRNSVVRRHSVTGSDVQLFSSPFLIGRLSRGPDGLLAA